MNRFKDSTDITKTCYKDNNIMFSLEVLSSRRVNLKMLEKTSLSSWSLENTLRTRSSPVYTGSLLFSKDDSLGLTRRIRY